MKKFYVYVVLLIIMLPLNVFAYSNYVYVGGDTIGINIKYNGVVGGNIKYGECTSSISNVG